MIAACVALYFNVFVLVVQAFEKVPAAKGTAICNHAAGRIGAFLGPDNVGGEEIPDRADDGGQLGRQSSLILGRLRAPWH